MFRSFSNQQLMVMFLGSKKLLAAKQPKTALVQWMTNLSKELVHRKFTDFHGWHDYSHWGGFQNSVIEPYRNRSILKTFSSN